MMELEILLHQTAVEVRQHWARKQWGRQLDLYRKGSGAEWKLKADELQAKIDNGIFIEDSGCCGYVGPLLTKALRARGIRVRTVFGRYFYELPSGGFVPHCWNVSGKLLVDATAHQFGERNIVVTNIADERYKAKTRRSWAYGP